MTVDKSDNQQRLYAITRLDGEGQDYDDDVVHAAVWLHDLGVFYGHRPAEIEELKRWDSVKYAMERTPGLLTEFGLPSVPIEAVVEGIRTHQPQETPATIEGTILRD